MNQEELLEAFQYYSEHPYEFVVDIIGATPTSDQKQVLDIIPTAIRENKGISIRSGHGTGKTSCLCWIILWFMSCFPYAKVPCTATTQNQLFDVLWSELSKWFNKCCLKDIFVWNKTSFAHKDFPETWFSVARSSNKPENLAGFHADHLLFLMDEASGIDSEIFDVIEGTQTQKGSLIIMTGNPTQIKGGFYDSFHDKRNFFYTFVFNSENSNLVDPQYCEKIASKYGKDSDLYRVRVLGEFPQAEPNTFISLDIAEKAGCRELPLLDVGAYEVVELGVDVARFGDDETTVYRRIGDVITEELFLRKNDLMSVTGAVVNVIKKYHVTKTVIVNVDDSGLGGGVTDRLNELVNEGVIKAIIVPVNNGSSSYDNNYFNKGAEMWGFFKGWLLTGSIPNDQELVAQICTRKYSINSKGKIVMESKEHMKQRGLYSPDRADGAILAIHSLAYGMVNNSARSMIF